MITKGLFIILSFALSGFSANAAEYLVKYKEGAEYQMQAALAGAEVADFSETASVVKMTIDEKSEGSRLVEIMSDPSVEYIVPNFKIESFTLPMTPQTSLRDQWAMLKVRATDAWAKAGNRGSKKVIVAVIDSGVDSEHESLKPNMIPGFNLKDNNTDTSDIVGPTNPGHGTHCAGVVGGTGLVANGIVGIAPDVSIMPLRFLGADGRGDAMGAIKAIDYAVKNGAKIISASWGAKIKMNMATPLLDAVKRADAAGVIFVAAAANDGADNDRVDVYPANTQFWNTITVGASNSSDQKPQWSNFGRNKVHLAAPGEQIMSTVPGNGYKALSGTSMATPMVAGLVAMMVANEPNLTGAQAKAILQTTGVKMQMDSACNCRIDAAAAMASLLERRQTIVPAAVTMVSGQSFKSYVLYGRGNERFSSSNPSVLRVDADGTVTAVSVGSAVVEAVDFNGQSHKSLQYHVIAANNGIGNAPPAPAPGKCPHSPIACRASCVLNPQNPWCSRG